LKKRLICLCIILCIFFVSSIFAQSVGVQSVGFQTHFGEVLDYIFFTPYFAYLRTNRSDKSIDLSMQYASFGSKIIGYINSKPKGFFTGIGISYNIILSESINSQLDQNEPFIKQSNDTKIGLASIIGYLFKMNTISINLESRYTFMQGGFNTWQIGAGVIYYLD
jgi:hypothetical protein